MLENNLNEIILCVEQEMNLIKIKIKVTKKELKQLEKVLDNKYVDNERIEKDKVRLTQEISEAKERLNKLKKILYRLKVCERILNNEEY